MELRSHEQDAEIVVVTVENALEDRLVDENMPDFFGEVLIDGEFASLEQRAGKYPYDVEISRIALGRIAGKGMVRGDECGLLVAKEALTYFESNPTLHRQKISAPLAQAHHPDRPG